MNVLLKTIRWPYAAAATLFVAGFALLGAAYAPEQAAREGPPRIEWGMVIHGGAGSIEEVEMTPAEEEAYRQAMTEALRAGYEILAAGGNSVDAVEAAIRVMEDSPLFNAGRGAVFTASGGIALDASIMNGKTHQAGAVTGVSHIKHPITLARMVMEESRHVMLAGAGAEEFALELGMDLVPMSYFWTEDAWESFQQVQERMMSERTSMGPSPRPAEWRGYSEPLDFHFGTVGAVALDKQGDLAAGTSTGGMTYKRWGRIGDSPIIGAGTYANNKSCAVSATGHGEYFIRNVVAHDICARMRYKDIPLRQAARTVILDKLVRLGGSGGVITMDAEGHIAWPYNTPGMFRGYITADGETVVKFY